MMRRKVLQGLFFLGRLVSPFYSCLMVIRTRLYRKGVVRSVRLPVPVVCVGNLTMGGTGKTPMVQHVAGLLAKKMKPAVLSRGYGGRSQGKVAVVSAGKAVLLGPREAGDEPFLLASSLPGVPVLCGPRRSETGRYAVDHGLADVLILDDGFQHLALQRDLDIVLFHAPSPLGNGWVFPGGELREPFSGLGRADCFVLTGMTSEVRSQVDSFCTQLRRAFPVTPLYEAEYQPTVLTDRQGEVYPFEKLLGLPLFLFCGIAQPEAFVKMAAGLFDVRGSQVFRDHHPYLQEELDLLNEMALSAGCRALLVTEKDLVKLGSLHSKLPLFAVRISLVLDKDFDAFVLGRIASVRRDELR